MQIAVAAADFSAGEADQLRRSMAAWKRRGGLEPFRERLLSGMAANGYSSEFANAASTSRSSALANTGSPNRTPLLRLAHLHLLLAQVPRTRRLHCRAPEQPADGLLSTRATGAGSAAQWREHPAARRTDQRMGLHAGNGEWRSARHPHRSGAGALASRGRTPSASSPHANSNHSLASRNWPTGGAFPAEPAAPGARRRTAVFERTSACGQLAGPRRRTTAGHAGTCRRERARRDAAASAAQEIMADYQQLSLSTTDHPLRLLRQRLRALGSAATWSCVRCPMVRGCVSEAWSPTCNNPVPHRRGIPLARGRDRHRQRDSSGRRCLRRTPAGSHRRLLEVNGTLQNQHGVTHVVARTLHDRSRWLAGVARRSRDFH